MSQWSKPVSYTHLDVYKRQVVDSQSEDNALDLDIKNTGDAEWKIQVKQGSVTLEEDQWYTLSFDIRSSMARSIQ